MKFDWLVSKSWNRLHYELPETWTDDQREDMACEWAVLSPVRLACGRMAGGVWVPGVGTQMGAERCKGCCRAAGLSEGTGSPKNCPEGRAWLGLDAA